MSVLLLGQSLFYLITGLWPILHYPSFAKVTGPKTDVWLLCIVGWFITIIGVVLLAAYFLNEVSTSLFILGAGAPLMLAGADIYYVSKKVISKVYLYDAFVEIVIVAAWLVMWFAGKMTSPFH
ncbi:hypothetical protein AZI87_08630 [Bdellovibrio bacteriovorus]|uniref:Uncharacterized protein n=1 Tax=Bdellovibrio bacteriovorus TaxID=959 RepID=A0A162GYT4_BDEBC|nr:hypothetical protein [Bdellovibrio bacteriovorus]KYG69259.1 hypothetical protein AZI87_08630 [Bdellovibrio bacteriovorus]